jgi:hypothetical protein
MADENASKLETTIQPTSSQDISVEASILAPTLSAVVAVFQKLIDDLKAPE